MSIIRYMRRYVQKIIIVIIVIFGLMNVVAAYHGYKFTHFSKPAPHVPVKPENLSTWEKIAVLIKGKDNPRPQNDSVPAMKYEEVILQGPKGKLSAWFIPKEKAKGTVILFHGYGGDKSKCLAPAAVFDSMGYQTMLVDFAGSGGSDGNSTSVGYFEADDVKAAYDYCRNKDSNIILFGGSMGASAIIRAVSVYNIHPAKLILECPFGSIADAAKNRFKTMGIPPFPMASLLVFWGGIETGFWAFSNDCVAYAKDIKMPTLLMRGLQDKYVSAKEISGIYANMQGHKKLYLLPHAGHESYCKNYHDEWAGQVSAFLHE